MTAITARMSRFLDQVDETARTMSAVRLARGTLVYTIAIVPFLVGLLVRILARAWDSTKRWVVSASRHGYRAGRGSAR